MFLHRILIRSNDVIVNQVTIYPINHIRHVKSCKIFFPLYPIFHNSIMEIILIILQPTALPRYMILDTIHFQMNMNGIDIKINHRSQHVTRAEITKTGDATMNFSCDTLGSKREYICICIAEACVSGFSRLHTIGYGTLLF